MTASLFYFLPLPPSNHLILLYYLFLILFTKAGLCSQQRRSNVINDLRAENTARFGLGTTPFISFSYT
jgi:hypothetical protein